MTEEPKTEERWEARRIEGSEEIWYDEDGYWAVVVEGEEINGEPIEVCITGSGNSDSTKQRAEKIAAMYNALAGIPDPAAFVEAAKKHLEDIKLLEIEITDLIAQSRAGEDIEL